MADAQRTDKKPDRKSDRKPDQTSDQETAERTGVTGTRQHQPPPGASVEDTWATADGGELPYRATGEWMLLREKEQPVAEMFSVAYVHRHAEAATRPVTFVFNGGPGASSAFLHVGAIGPHRVSFADDGATLPPPARLVHNAESWLAFTDLVFIDPIGTGFSRLVDQRGATAEGRPEVAPSGDGRKGAGDDEKRFFALERDLDSLGEFISRWLSANERWASPVLIAGESYGGYRVGKLAKKLPQDFGVGLNGAVLISPALEFALLDPSDYDVLPWVDLLPTMAGAAHHHGKGRALAADATVAEVREAAADFASDELARFLVRGARMPADERTAVLARLADFLGLPEDQVVRAEGRIGLMTFARDLLRTEGRVVGLYDASVASRNPFPDRDAMEWPDPTLHGSSRVFTSGVNQQVRDRIGVTTDREYVVLSLEVNSAWQRDQKEGSWERMQVGATDDLRYAMSLSPELRVFVTHGFYDLVTPYHASDRLGNLMRLRPEDGDRLRVRHFDGGHMFYTWAESRVGFRDEAAAFVERATAR